MKERGDIDQNVLDKHLTKEANQKIHITKKAVHDFATLFISHFNSFFKKQQTTKYTYTFFSFQTRNRLSQTFKVLLHM